MDQFSTQIRHFRPIAPDKTEVTIYCIAPKGESAEARRMRIRNYEDFFNPTGMATPDDTIASWSANTLDYRHIQWRMAELDIEPVVAHELVDFAPGALRLRHVWNDRERTLPCASIVTITSRLPDDALLDALREREADWTGAGIRTVTRIGDALAPGLIAHAVYAGHRYARALDAPPEGEVPFKRHFHTPRETDLRRED